MDQGKPKDRREPGRLAHDVADHDSLAGSGSTSFGDFAAKDAVHDIEGKGAEPVVGSLAAWGGVGERVYSNPDSRAREIGKPDIDKPGYPMSGDNAGGGTPGATGVKGEMDKGGSAPDKTPSHPSHKMRQDPNV